MVADFTMFSKRPGGVHILFRFIEISTREIDPAKRVPIGVEFRNHSQISIRNLIKRKIPQRVRDGSYSRLRILLRAIEMGAFQR